MEPTPDAYAVLSADPDLRKSLRLIALGDERHFIIVARAVLSASREGRKVSMEAIDWHAIYERFRGGDDGSPR